MSTTHPTGPAAGTGRATRMRLTRRGRILLTLLALALAAGIGLVAGQAMAAGPAEPPAPTPVSTVHVAPGDSLWSIASSIAGERDVRDVVAEIERLNSLTSATIVAGQELAVPQR